MLQSFAQFKPFFAQNIHFISKKFNSHVAQFNGNVAQLQAAQIQSGSGSCPNSYSYWIGKIPAHDEIKRAVEHIVREGQVANRPNIMRVIQQESDRRAREMKAKNDPFAW